MANCSLLSCAQEKPPHTLPTLPSQHVLFSGLIFAESVHSQGSCGAQIRQQVDYSSGIAGSEISGYLGAQISRYVERRDLRDPPERRSARLAMWEDLGSEGLLSWLVVRRDSKRAARGHAQGTGFALCDNDGFG